MGGEVSKGCCRVRSEGRRMRTKEIVERGDGKRGGGREGKWKERGMAKGEMER